MSGDVRHIAMVFGRDNRDTFGSTQAQFKIGWLCSTEHRRQSVANDWPTCDKCFLIESVLKANVPPWWLGFIPFQRHGTFTICARFYALCVLGLDVVSDFTQPPPAPLFTKWQLAGTYKRLSDHIAAVEKCNVGTPARRGSVSLPGCHFCGTAPRPHMHVKYASCSTCGSTEMTLDEGFTPTGRPP